jgi:hypothetical protein
LIRVQARKLLVVAYCLTSLTGSAAIAAESNRSSTTIRVETNSRSTVGDSKLSQVGLERCLQRERQIKLMIGSSVEHFERKSDVLTKISDRVQDFADRQSTKPSNYLTLVAAVESAHEAVLEEMDDLEDAGEFSCQDNHPKRTLINFLDHIRTQRSLVKDYQQAVRDLIVGVKSAQGQQSSNNLRGNN